MKKLALINSLGGTYHLVQYHNSNLYLLNDDEPSLIDMVDTNNNLWDFLTFLDELDEITEDDYYEVYCIDEDFLNYVINAINETEDESMVYYIGSHFYKNYSDDDYIMTKCSLKLDEMGLL